MEVALAPPPPPRSRVQELGDDLIVRFRPRRSWGELAFLTFWLLAWTGGGIGAFAAFAGADRGARVFLAVWLCGWLFGGGFTDRCLHRTVGTASSLEKRAPSHVRRGLLCSDRALEPQRLADPEGASAPTHGFPAARDFSRPREYAAAVTVYTLRSAGTTVLKLPGCGTHVTWTGWSCVATARASAGPFAGRALTYRCSATASEQIGGRPELRGVACGPVDPPPIG